MGNKTLIENVFGGLGMSPIAKHTKSKRMPINKEDNDKVLAFNKLLGTSKSEDLADECSLRVRLFDTTNCCDHQSQAHLFALHLPKVDFFNETCCTILYELENSKFIGYSCLVIIVHDKAHLGTILKALEGNRHLRYKSKLLLWRRNEKILSGRTKSHPLFDCNPDNTIIFEWCMDQNVKFDYADVLYCTFQKPYTPLQAVLDVFVGTYVVASNADLYVYSINPALAIIINNYYFTSPHTIREGSDQDVVHLIRELKIAGIPYMLMEDCDRQELLEVLDYIEKKDFSPVKSFLIFLMSHGDSNNVLYTHDGQVDINTDVVNRIQSNRSLQNAEKLIVVNACRGAIDVELADEDDLDQIKPTENIHLAPSTVVWYSVPNGVQSVRCPNTGCPFIQSFCRHFRNIDPEDDIQTVDKKIDTDLKGIDYFDGLKKCSDLVVKNPHQRHNIIHLPIAAKQMLALMKTISKDFPIWEKHDHTNARYLYVGGTLNRAKFPKTDVMWKYFAPDLDLDTCSVDKDSWYQLDSVE